MPERQTIMSKDTELSRGHQLLLKDINVSLGKRVMSNQVTRVTCFETPLAAEPCHPRARVEVYRTEPTEIRRNALFERP